MAKGDREWWRSGRPAGSNPTPRDLEGRPFASGRFRVCYKGRYAKGNMKNKPLVAKVRRSGTQGLRPRERGRPAFSHHTDASPGVQEGVCSTGRQPHRRGRTHPGQGHRDPRPVEPDGQDQEGLSPDSDHTPFAKASDLRETRRFGSIETACRKFTSPGGM